MYPAPLSVMPAIARLQIKKIITDTPEKVHPILAYIVYVIEVGQTNYFCFVCS